MGGKLRTACGVSRGAGTLVLLAAAVAFLGRHFSSAACRGFRSCSSEVARTLAPCIVVVLSKESKFPRLKFNNR